MAEQPTLECKIRDLAYSKWELAGCPDTSDDERNQFWLEAEKEVLANKMPVIKSINRK